MKYSSMCIWYYKNVFYQVASAFKFNKNSKQYRSTSNLDKTNLAENTKVEKLKTNNVTTGTELRTKTASPLTCSHFTEVIYDLCIADNI